MTCRVLVLTIAAGVSLTSAALAKPNCAAGQIYYRSRHTCVAKEVAIERGIYHHHTKVDGTTVIRQTARLRAAPFAAAIPLPPARFARDGTASTAARTEQVDSAGSTIAPTPETTWRSMSPYGALVPVTSTE